MKKLSIKRIIAGVLIGGSALFFAAHIWIAIMFGRL